MRIAYRERDVNAVDKDGWTALMIAAGNGEKEVCELLIEKGANVNAVDKVRRTALMAAASNSHKEVCHLLIEKEADVNLSDYKRDTALTLSNEKEVVALLIKSTVDLLLRDDTPIYKYSDKQLDKLKELIVEMKLDINSLIINQKPLLVLALEKEDIDLCKFLLALGADIPLQSKEGITPLTRAILKGNLNIVSLLLEKENC